MVNAEPELQARSRVFNAQRSSATDQWRCLQIDQQPKRKRKHGGNLHAALIDELHVINDPELVDVLETSMRARRQPVVLYTTTAGDNPESIAGEIHDYGSKVRDGIINDPEFLPVIYEVPKTADVKDPATWKLAQPNLGVTVPVAEYERDLKKALAVPRFMSVFKQLSCNQFTEATSCVVIGLAALASVCRPEVNPRPLQGLRAFAGHGSVEQHLTRRWCSHSLVDATSCCIRPYIFIPRRLEAAGRCSGTKRDKSCLTLSGLEQGQSPPLNISDRLGNAADCD